MKRFSQNYFQGVNIIFLIFYLRVWYPVFLPGTPKIIFWKSSWILEISAWLILHLGFLWFFSGYPLEFLTEFLQQFLWQLLMGFFLGPFSEAFPEFCNLAKFHSKFLPEFLTMFLLRFLPESSRYISASA